MNKIIVWKIFFFGIARLIRSRWWRPMGDVFFSRWRIFWRLTQCVPLPPRAKAETKSRRTWITTTPGDRSIGRLVVGGGDGGSGGRVVVVVIIIVVVVVVVVIEGENLVERRTVCFAVQRRRTGGQQQKRQRFFFFFSFKMAFSALTVLRQHANCCLSVVAPLYVLCARCNTTTHNFDERRDVT